jgi:hypothetical protein
MSSGASRQRKRSPRAAADHVIVDTEGRFAEEAQPVAKACMSSAAASIMGEEESRMGITHAGFAMTSLPHKRIEETVWRRSGPNTTLLVAFL